MLKELSVFTFLLCIKYWFIRVPRVLIREILLLCHDYRFYCHILNMNLTYNIRKIFEIACEKKKYIDIIAPYIPEDEKQYVYFYKWIPERINLSDTNFLIKNFGLLAFHEKKSDIHYINIIKIVAPLLSIESIKELLSNFEEKPYKYDIKVLEILVPLLFKAEEEEVRIHHSITDMNFISKYITEKNAVNNARLIINKRLYKYYDYIYLNNDTFKYIIKYENMILFNKFLAELTPNNPQNIRINSKSINYILKHEVLVKWLYTIIPHNKYYIDLSVLFLNSIKYNNFPLLKYANNSMSLIESDLLYVSMLDKKLPLLENKKHMVKNLRDILLNFKYTDYKYFHYCLYKGYYDKIKEKITSIEKYEKVCIIYINYFHKDKNFEFFHYLRTHKYNISFYKYISITFINENSIIYNELEERIEEIFLDDKLSVEAYFIFISPKILKYYKDLIISCVNKKSIKYRKQIKDRLINVGYDINYVNLYIYT